MEVLTVRQTRQQLRAVLDSAEKGEVVRIRRGKRLFRLTIEPTAEADSTFPNRDSLRAAMKFSGKDTATYLSEDRDR